MKGVEIEKRRAAKRWHRIAKNSDSYEWSIMAEEKL